jgi:hypothetical protein
MKKNMIERRGKLEDLDRTFDIEFWQSLTSKERFDAAWELILHTERAKGNDVRQLQLLRSIENFQRQQR